MSRQGGPRLATLLHGAAAPQAIWQAGDRLSVQRTQAPHRFRLPAGLSPNDLPPIELTSVDGRTLDAHIDWAAGDLVIPDLATSLGAGPASLQLEFHGDRRFRLVVESPD